MLYKQISSKFRSCPMPGKNGVRLNCFHSNFKVLALQKQKKKVWHPHLINFELIKNMYLQGKNTFLYSVLQRKTVGKVVEAWSCFWTLMVDSMRIPLYQHLLHKKRHIKKGGVPVLALSPTVIEKCYNNSLCS